MRMPVEWFYESKAISGAESQVSSCDSFRVMRRFRCRYTASAAQSRSGKIRLIVRVFDRGCTVLQAPIVARESGVQMPRVTGIPGPYRISFSSVDCAEPIHVHVVRETKTCKFWLEPLSLARSQGFSPRELNTIRRLISNHRITLKEAWREHCGQ